MANVTPITSNVSKAIGEGFVGTIGANDVFGFALVGGIIILIFMFWIFRSRLGFWGLAVILPPLAYILASTSGEIDGQQMGWLPAWIVPIIWVIVGVAWAMIILRLVREA